MQSASKQLPLVYAKSSIKRWTAFTRLPILTLFLVSQSWSEATPDQPKKLAPELFTEAATLRTALESKPKRLHTPTEYEKVISKYRAVYYEFPNSSKADDALIAVAELYQFMGSDFHDPTAFVRAAKTYLFLEKEYPASPRAAEALFLAAEIQLTDLGNRQAAQELFGDLLKRYPQSEKARNARARLNDLKEATKQSKTPSPRHDVVPSPSAKLQKEEPTLQALTPSELKDNTSTEEVFVTSSGVRNKMPLSLSDIRFWNTERCTRVIITTTGEAQYEEGRLEGPPRVFIDIENTRLVSALFGRSFSLNDGFVTRIRLGQVKDQVARIVLDLGTIERYEVSRLSAPCRIVVDLYGGDRTSLLRVDKSAEWRVRRGERLPDELTPATASLAKLSESAKLSSQTKGPNGDIVTRGSGRVNSSEPSPIDTASRNVQLRRTAATRQPQKSPEIPETHAADPRSDGTRSLIRTLGLKIGRIVIDPGHGGYDNGTVGPSGLREKDLVLDVSLKLKQLIEERLGSEVILTRSDDTFIPLEDRTLIANQTQADLFLSIHANSSSNHRVSGVETFFLDFAVSSDVEEIAARENASSQKTIFELQDLVQKITLRENVEESREFASILQRSVTSHLQRTRKGTRDRGVKQAPFIVLIGANMPSILSELSFVSNPIDEKLLKSSSYRQKLAEALCRGVETYAESLSGIKTAKNIH